MTHPRAARRAFSLAEVMASLGLMSVLLVGMGSTIFIASNSLPARVRTADMPSDASTALRQLARELESAISITELSGTAITFSVADRGHAPPGPEVIRYAWSGTPGEALTRSYNSGTPQVLASRVDSLTLTPTIIPGPVVNAPRVVMVVNSLSPTTEDTDRQAKLTSWGFSVTTLLSSATQAEFDAAYSNGDVVYFPDGVGSFTMYSRIGNPSVGIVCEAEGAWGAAGASTFIAYSNGREVTIVDNSHMITQGIPTGDLRILGTNETLHATAGTTSPDLIILGRAQGGGSSPSLALLEVCARRSDGQKARARRVVLPWGGTLLDPFDYAELRSPGRTILKRSLVWASAPPVYAALEAKLTTSTGDCAKVSATLPNQPRLPRP